jgi:branched-chain amino acid transport system permease protein
VLVAFGGLGTLLGPVIGAGVLAYVDEELSSRENWLQLREVLYGLFVIAIFLFFRRGVVSTVQGWFNRLTAFRRGKATVEPSRE